MSKKILITVLIVTLLTPLWMWIFWYFSPKKILVAAIIDKTSMDDTGQEHISLTWLLNNKRILKTATKSYRPDHDYFGFFPLRDEKFRLKGLERFSSDQIKNLSVDADMAYFADTYGIYKNEWYLKKHIGERSQIIYGGLSSQDLDFMQQMKSKRKLVVVEFNTIGSPTSEINRLRFERMFGLTWLNWTGRYFESFDTIKNKELPKWLINSYKLDNRNSWPFHKSGIAFVSNTNKVVILEDSTHLSDPLPHIVTGAYGQEKLELPKEIKYSYWFDVVSIDSTINRRIANFHISTNPAGRYLLKKNGIPETFPAVVMHKGSDYHFYYFSGDFCDNDIHMTSSYFKGIGFFKWLFYNTSDPMERSSFFWNYYRPLMSNILDAAEKK